MSAADFWLIRPVAITDAMLISSTVPEGLAQEYSSGSTYVLGAVVGVSTGTKQAVYQGLQASNVGHAPATSPTWWKPLGTVYAPYSTGTSYGLGDVVSSTSANVHDLYESQAAGNLGNALTDKAKWLRKSATNRWNAFDKALNSRTVVPNSISFVIAPGLVNTVTLLNVEGASATITQSGTGYTRTQNLVRHHVLNWYDFFYEIPIRIGDVVFDGVPPYAASSLTITIENTGLDAAISGCFVGKSRTIGTTQWGVTGGTLSYSTVDTDKFGNVTIFKRANAKRLNFEVRIPDGFEDEAHRLLTEYTDVELIVIGSTKYSMTYAYGYIDQWEVPISNSGQNAPISFRGLI
ncbi:hypothetical protein CR152_10240 [Massilia violaceinigra]|uniref:Chitin-binding type-3 domain-containing protein n=1 Tax=Massilia violaceinigra TaxID=2045208 RepID=A0A2D2DIP6_9BURK|nr:hypothetical protein [Massilia violaceinigra]ATQ74860.1 hypothetical protein CR152_10240 [Massilia violaceinigra]